MNMLIVYQWALTNATRKTWSQFFQPLMQEHCLLIILLPVGVPATYYKHHPTGFFTFELGSAHISGHPISVQVNNKPSIGVFSQHGLYCRESNLISCAAGNVVNCFIMQHGNTMLRPQNIGQRLSQMSHRQL